MALFSKFKGGDKKPEEAAEEEGPKREHERKEIAGAKLAILPATREFEVLDVSEGGLAITGYDGKLRGNQYFEFKLMGEKDGKAYAVEGMATVVRVKDEKLAAKFPPQPRLKNFLRENF